MLYEKDSLTPWRFDPIHISEFTATPDGVIYKFQFVDFMHIIRVVEVRREDIFFNFEKVMRDLVKAGYRFSVEEHGDEVLRNQLIEITVPQQDVEKALAKQIAQSSTSEQSQQSPAEGEDGITIHSLPHKIIN